VPLSTEPHVLPKRVSFHIVSNSSIINGLAYVGGTAGKVWHSVVWMFGVPVDCFVTLPAADSVGIALNNGNLELGSNGQCTAGEDEGAEFDK
jgi:hypothetical protein